MTEETKEMKPPKVQLRSYQCHKVVQAARIYGTHCPSSPGDLCSLHLRVSPERDEFVFEVSTDWFKKHDPHAGGYFVVYEGGYMSYSPADAFEAGYSLISEGDHPDA